MIEFLQNKYLLYGLGAVIILVLWKIFVGKDESAEIVTKEYNEVLKSDKYKVKGQHD